MGLSGGIDSAVTAALASLALGPSNVLTLMMPTSFTSTLSLRDAKNTARMLGVEYKVIKITGLVRAYNKLLKGDFKILSPGIAEENIQARIRGTLLMAYSNKFGKMVLATGNKSELAVGYSTLYGDMAGGFAPLSDVPKTMVFDIAKFLNDKKHLIPISTIERPPSAELAPDQKDTDSLPPYPLLDKLIEYYVEDGKDFAEAGRLVGDKKVAKKVFEMLERNEYKRQQAPPGIKITSKAFGSGRRLPITKKQTF